MSDICQTHLLFHYSACVCSSFMQFFWIERFVQGWQRPVRPALYCPLVRLPVEQIGKLHNNLLFNVEWLDA